VARSTGAAQGCAQVSSAATSVTSNAIAQALPGVLSAL
jgi:hypothetical protein